MVVASVIPDMIEFMNLIGAISSSTLAFILPPLMYIKVTGIRNISKLTLVFNIFIMLFGAAGGAYSFYVSLVQLIDSYKD